MSRRQCVVAGGGPGGMVLAHLLGRAGIAVTVLESHHDFDRDFRGDSLHPYTMELLDQLGLADELLRLPHRWARSFRLHTPTSTATVADYGRLPSRFNYVVLMPQARFLTFMAARLAELPDVRVRTGCKVTNLVRDEDDRIRGVVYRAGTGTHELAADLVVGADGRFSKLRGMVDLPVKSSGARTDLLWFRLPRRPADPANTDLELHFGRDHYIGLLAGTGGWNVGYSLPKGGYQAARAAGVAPIRTSVAERVPWLADRVHLLESFRQTTLLPVEIARVDRWWRPGLLLIGDAAHVISPVGGNGILMAVQDAVTAANHLVPALRRGDAGTVDHALQQIQAEREPAIERVQAQQVRTEARVARSRGTGKPIATPALLRVLTAVPGFRRRAARANAYGPEPPALNTPPLGCDPGPGEDGPDVTG